MACSVQKSFDRSLWLMNARLATLAEVLRSDTQWLLTNYFPQTRLFLFLNVLAVWSAAVWMLWGVLRWRRAFAAVLPLTILGVMLTALDAFLILWLQNKGVRWLEALIFGFIVLIFGSFAVQIALSHPVWGDVLRGYVPSA